MPEQRARTYHRNRVASTFSEEIGAMLEGELSDPRIAESYVTEVVLAPGGKSARVFVAVHGSEEEEESTLAGLMTARAYIRSQLRDRMGVRHVPELTFAIDRSKRMTGRMDELLGRMRKRDRKREEKTPKAGAPATKLSATDESAAKPLVAKQPVAKLPVKPLPLEPKS
jgi:ribosome-binding factor A